ncbi:hypothetical protein MPH47_09680 [Psychrobacillus psychrodurans]|uniref:hypothetical protein n=1 Tax=Psychrobacillus psychrodurans TaxID=126157 RepID=UPI001F4EA6DF|nr:hypothetical protein [Psychrobacillus psychrodurans]MCK1997486.1 hypothetical protein [Psychrobacillus psychrodurans]
MYKWIAIIILITIVMIGVIKVLRDWSEHQKNLKFTSDFINKFREFGNDLFNKNFNQENYQWLKLNSFKMQSLSGDFGVARTFKPAGANYFFKGYQIIINGVTEVKNIYQRMSSSFGGLSFEWQMLQESIGMIDDALLSYFGFLENKSEQKFKAIKNPLIWFREGIQFIVTLPISLVYWSGIINYGAYSKVYNNIFVKLISLTVGVIAFISSIITIVTGYVPFSDFMKDLFLNSKY